MKFRANNEDLAKNALTVYGKCKTVLKLGSPKKK